jgi:hypothetical protein
MHVDWIDKSWDGTLLLPASGSGQAMEQFARYAVSQAKLKNPYRLPGNYAKIEEYNIISGGRRSGKHRKTPKSVHCCQTEELQGR